MNPVFDVCVREPIMDPVLDVCVREPIMVRVCVIDKRDTRGTDQQQSILILVILHLQ
jgi:hypothetical protein